MRRVSSMLSLFGVSGRPIVLQALLMMLLASGLHAESGGALGKSLYPLDSYGLEGTLPVVQGKIVLLDFWASWCGPCAKSFPALDLLYKEYRERGVVILGVNVDEKRSGMDKFLEKMPVSFPIVRDAMQKLVGRVNVGSMPTSVLLDRNGRERFRHSGFRGEETMTALRAHLDTLLGEP